MSGDTMRGATYEGPDALAEGDKTVVLEMGGFMQAESKAQGPERPGVVLPMASLSRQCLDESIHGPTAPAIQSFCWFDLSYTVPLLGKAAKEAASGADTKAILQGVSGEVHASEIMALIGPSGSGKTSLLNVLAQRVKPEHVTGEIRVNGHRITRSIKHITGYVFQDDLMLDNLTVFETIYYSARLRLPQEVGVEACVRRTEHLLDLLKLKDCKHTRIGGAAHRGVSGGERKRTSIAVELITSPTILFLDEPTSGLDASTALTLVTLLKEVAVRNRMMCVASIHQPRESIFNIFDKVMLLCRGCVAYMGTTKEAFGYFHRTLNLDAPTYNLADWMLDVVTHQCKSRGELGCQLAKLYSSQGPVQLSSMSEKEGGEDFLESIKAVNTWKGSFWHQFRVLLERSNKQQRGSVFSKVSFLQTIGVGVVVSALWWQNRYVQDIQGMLFFILIQQSMNVITAVMRIFPSERSLLLRERMTGSYRIGAYFLAKTCSDLQVTYVAPALFASMVYWCVGLRTDPWWSFLAFLGIFISCIMAAHALGLLISAAIPNFAVGNTVSFVVSMMLFLFSGFYVQNNRIPLGIDWIKYTSFPYWTYKTLIVIVFRGLEIPCRYGEGEVPSCPFNGDAVVKARGFSGHTIWLGFVMIWIFIILYRYLAYVALRISSAQKM